MKKHKKIIIPIIIVFILFGIRFHYIFSKPVSISESFPDLNKVRINYSNLYIEDGTPESEIGEWDLVDYPEKQEQIKQVLEKYCYYSRPYKKSTGFGVENSGKFIQIVIMDETLKSITIFENTNKVFYEQGAYVLKSVEDGDTIITEIVEIMKK